MLMTLYHIAGLLKERDASCASAVIARHKTLPIASLNTVMQDHGGNVRVKHLRH